MNGDDANDNFLEGRDASLLIVDDDKPFLTRLARAMESRGFAVDTAETVEEMQRRHPAMATVTVGNQGHAPMLKDTATIEAIRHFLTATDAGRQYATLASATA